MANSTVFPERILAETWIRYLEHHETLPSTQIRARDMATNGEQPLPALILADRQTSGRGQRGRSWWTGQNCLAFTLLAEPNHCLENGRGPQLSLLTALAVAESVEPILGDKTVGIHWPNDVIVGGRKLAGILVEKLVDARILVGVGVNTNDSLAAAPPDICRIATSILEQSGITTDHTELIVEILRRMESIFAQMPDDDASLTARLNSRCLLRDHEIVAETGGRQIRGLCRGLRTDGAMLLQTAGGTVAIHSGTIPKGYFRP